MKTPAEAGDTIRVEMVRCGYTTETLCQRTMISRPVLRKILSGRAETISTRNICALANAFGYSVADFMDLLASAK